MSSWSQEQNCFPARRSASISTWSYDSRGQHPRRSDLVSGAFDSTSSLTSAQYNASGRSFPSRHSIALYPSASTSTNFRVSQHLTLARSSRRFSDVHGGVVQIRSMEEHDVLNGMTSEAMHQIKPPSCAALQQPERTRRYGTYSGDLRKESANLEALSTTTLSESDSERDLALNEISAADFPEPPPIGSPIIRRMRSSPWFLPERRSNKDFSDVHQWRSAVPMDSRPPGRRYDPLSEPLSTSAKEKIRLSTSSSAQQGVKDVFSAQPVASSTRDKVEQRGLENWEKLQSFDFQEFNSLDLHPEVSFGNISSESGTMSNRTIPSPLRFSKDLPSKTELRVNDRYNTTESDRPETRPLTLGALPRIIRKVASMRSDSQKGDINRGENFNASTRVGQKTLPKARSFRSIIRASDGDQGFKRNSHIEGTRTIWPSGSASGDMGLGSTKYSDSCVQSYGHFEGDIKERMRRHHLSSPVTSSGASGSLNQQMHVAANTCGPGRLGDPFSHRLEYTGKPLQKMEFAQTQSKDAKSFIDFTPEQGSKPKVGAKRERIKNMVARANNSLLGWGKWKTKKSSVG